MKYVMLMYQGDALARQAALPEEEQKQVYADYGALNEDPRVTGGVPMGLPENATTVRVEDGKTLTTDGPFVAVKEALGGAQPDPTRRRWSRMRPAASRTTAATPGRATKWVVMRAARGARACARRRRHAAPASQRRGSCASGSTWARTSSRTPRS